MAGLNEQKKKVLQKITKKTKVSFNILVNQTSTSKWLADESGNGPNKEKSSCNQVKNIKSPFFVSFVTFCEKFPSCIFCTKERMN